MTKSLQNSTFQKIFAVVLLLLLLCSFHPPPEHLFVHARPTTLAFASRAGSSSVKQQQQHAAVDAQQTSSFGTTNLKFSASTCYFADTLTTSTTTDSSSLCDFLFQPKYIQMILAGSSSNNPVEIISNPDIQLYKLWGVECKQQQQQQQQQQTNEDECLVAPAVGDSILKVTTTGIQFPGLLKLKTIATVGVKQVRKSNGRCELQVTLIQDELSAEGPEPIVWVFNQLTGSKKKKNAGGMSLFPPAFGRRRQQQDSSDDTRRSTHSTNVISAEYDNDNHAVVFSSCMSLSINVSFASFLLRILPVSKQLAEQQGSEAIQRVVSTDIGPALEKLCSEYQEWTKQQEKK